MGLDVFFFACCRWISTTRKENQHQQCCMSGVALFLDDERGKFIVSFSAHVVHGPCWLTL